ncbi:hypothetical protein JHK87_001249 [Glycine soja]|nr:hypothetical protein JHK87_001249 [Glycine soja]
MTYKSNICLSSSQGPTTLALIIALDKFNKLEFSSQFQFPIASNFMEFTYSFMGCGVGKKRYSGDRKEKSLMITWDDSDSEKCSSSDDEQTNIYMMEDIGKKVKAKTYFESYTCFECDTSSNASSDNEEEIPYDNLVPYGMIFTQIMRDVGVDMSGMAPIREATQLKGMAFMKMAIANNFLKYAQKHIKRKVKKEPKEKP